MSRRLKGPGSVLLPDESGQFVLLVPGTVVPEWAASQVDERLLESEKPLSEDEKDEEGPDPAETVSDDESGPEDDESGPEDSEGGPEDDESGPEDDESGPGDSEGDDDLIGGAPEEVEQPARDGKVDEWRTYARSKGATDEELAGKTRNELRSIYGS